MLTPNYSRTLYQPQDRSPGHAIQPQLEIGQPNDKYEQQADAVADKVMMMPNNTDEVQMQPLSSSMDISMKCAECEEEEGIQRQVEDEEEKIQMKAEDEEEEERVQMKDEEDKVQMKPALQKSGEGQMHASPSLTTKVKHTKGQGSTLPEDVGTEMGSKIGADFSNVKIHTDSNAVQMNEELGAQAFTHGNDIYFNKGKYAPQSSQGKHLLAHELTHVVQQKKTSAVNKKIQKNSLAGFRTNLENISADHKKVIEELFKHAKFRPMVKFLNGCPADTIDFQVRRIQQRVNGVLVDLFGGYSPPRGSSAGTMIVNPNRPEHSSNPLEVVDTVVHEFIHAIIDLKTACATSSNPFPLGASVKDAFSDAELNPLVVAEVASGGRDPFKRERVAHHHAAGVTTASGNNVIEYLENNYGPSASRPETHYVDLNREGLELVTSIISDIKSKHPAIGKETVSFDNVELMKAADLLSVRSWLNSRQFNWSLGSFKDRVAERRKIEKATFTDREYKISAIQVVEFADKKIFDSNTSGGFGNIGGVWICYKKSRFTGRTLKTAVTGQRNTPPGGSVDYKIVHHL